MLQTGLRIRANSVVALLLLPAAVGAQGLMTPAARVRVVPSDRHDALRTGRLVSVSGDTALVDFGPPLRSNRTPVPMTNLEVLAGTRRFTVPGMILGGPLAMIAGFYIGGRAFGTFCDGTRLSPSCGKDRSMELPLGIAGGLAGLGVGALVGHAIKHETWVPALRH
jgi:hypothetical protein